MHEKPLTVDTALTRLLEAALPVTEVETVPAESALGRILAVPLVAGIDVPPLDNSAMDGYALCTADWGRRGAGSRSASVSPPAQ